jgi:UDPglucose 6-dehydrogenase
VNTSRALYRAMRKQNPDADFETASNPEFLREGEAVKDFMSPDRIVIGAPTERSARVLRSLYRPQQLCGVPIVVMDPETAELSKYACNSFLATKVAFINDVSDMCEALDGDIRDVARAMGLDTRIGARFLQPGPGFGGSCFPKDTKAFVRMGQECGVPQRIVEAVVEGNEARKLSLIDTVRRAAGGTLRAAHVCVLGLTFKPNTDDVRESPSLTLIRELLSEGASVRVHDPQGLDRAREALGPAPIGYCRDVDSCVEGADVVAIVTDWPQYQSLHWPSVRTAMAGSAVVDFRNLCDPDAIVSAGLSYHGIGRRARGQRRNAVYSEVAA